MDCNIRYTKIPILTSIRILGYFSGKLQYIISKTLFINIFYYTFVYTIWFEKLLLSSLLFYNSIFQLSNSRVWENRGGVFFLFYVSAYEGGWGAPQDDGKTDRNYTWLILTRDLRVRYTILLILTLMAFPPGQAGKLRQEKSSAMSCFPNGYISIENCSEYMLTRDLNWNESLQQVKYYCFILAIK